MSRDAISHVSHPSLDVRDRILATALDLFYKQGVRAVGVDLVVEKAGVAKTSLYRHFSSKDDLVAAVLECQDVTFWDTWDRVAETHADDPRVELFAHLVWIAERAGHPEYRGCAQINAVAELPEPGHPARKVAKAHKLKMRLRLKRIAERLNAQNPDELAGQLTVLINGAFVSTSIFKSGEAVPLLRRTAETLLAASARPRPRRGRV